MFNTLYVLFVNFIYTYRYLATFLDYARISESCSLAPCDLRLPSISCRRSLNFSSSGMFLTGDSPLPSTKRIDVCLRAHQATPCRSEGVEWEETSVNSTPSVSCSSDACHFITSLEEASSYDATSTTCSNPIATRRNSRSNTLASTTRNSKRHTYNLRARKTNTG